MRELTIPAGSRQFTFSMGNAVTNAEIIQTEDTDGVNVYEIRLAFADVSGECSVSLLWREPMKGVVGYWSPHAGRAHELHQWWAVNTQTSYYAEGAPVIALFRQGGQNYRTAALSEAVCKTKLSVCVNDFAEKESLDLRVRIFDEEAPPAKEFTFYLRIDESGRNLSRCVGDVGTWWERFYPPRYRHSAENACAAPLLSSWYACHQHPTQDVLEKELPLAAELGFGAISWTTAGAIPATARATTPSAARGSRTKTNFPIWQGSSLTPNGTASTRHCGSRCPSWEWPIRILMISATG